MRRLMLTGLALGVAACSEAGAPPPANQAANAGRIVVGGTDTPATGRVPPAEQATAANAESIPARFRGVWAEGRAECAQQSHPSRLIISERVIRYPSLVLVSEGVSLPTEAGFAVKGYNQRTRAPAEAHFSIDSTGNILTDEAGGGAVRVRCG